MNVSTELQILKKIKKAKRGSLFFVEDFLRFGNSKTVTKALERLVAKEKIARVARGIYARLDFDPILGPVKPGAEDIAKAIAKRDKARIVPTGVLALNALGLSTQVPMNIVYLTDGAARRINIGKRKIIFKKVSPKNLAAIGEISRMVIQALKEIGKDKVTEKEKQIILKHLKNEDKYRLEHDIRLAPEWIRKIMRQALTE
ncbi:MAG: type IV toxin-antitoxin system AbiEi family antitoxin domain-containing protein [Prolixibacteraceae bacterium]|nr:type IV toxin-antitoxin system AbiEi family antitoxin domain-containing protein [Prolixibacteraceae bacterium]